MTTGDVVYSLRFSLIKILPEPGFDLGSTAGESCVLTAHILAGDPYKRTYIEPLSQRPPKNGTFLKVVLRYIQVRYKCARIQSGRGV